MHKLGKILLDLVLSGAVVVTRVRVVVITVQIQELVVPSLIILGLENLELGRLAFGEFRTTVIQVQLRLLAGTDLLTVDVDKDTLGSPEDFEPRVDSNRLTNSDIVDRIVSIRYVLQVDHRPSTKLWFKGIPVNCSDEVLVEILHPLRNTIVLVPVDVAEVLKVVEEGLILHLLVALAKFGVLLIIFAGSELRRNVDHIVEAKHAHVRVDLSVLDNLDLHLQHRH